MRCMPRGNENLRIEFDGHETPLHKTPVPPSFLPGDSIVGFVDRSAPIVATNARVTIALHGRIKAKIVTSRDNPAGTYHGQFDLLDEDELSLVLFEGPLHIPPPGEADPDLPAAASWPFSITIPTHCNPRKVCHRAIVTQPRSYLPLDSEAVAAQPLFDSFYVSTGGHTAQRHGYIEYFLKAHIAFNQKGKSYTEEAFRPIALRTRWPGPPITDMSLLRHRIPSVVSSFYLVPQMANTELSFNQKRQSILKSSKVPRIGGDFHLDAPRIIQLDNKTPVPISLRLVPDAALHRTSADMQGVAAKITLEKMTMEIASVTLIRCGDTKAQERDAEYTEIFQIWPPPRSLTPPEPLQIPCTTDDSPGTDIGTRVNFRIPSRTGDGLPHSQTTHLVPDFVAYSVKHYHRVKFEFTAKIADKEVKHVVQGRVTLRPPPQPSQERSESWIKPPAETEPL